MKPPPSKASEWTNAATPFPSAADWIVFARLMNGTCPTCGTINAYDKSRTYVRAKQRARQARRKERA